jgi:hypothetical protein
MKRPKVKTSVIICGLAAITIIECVALFNGIDGIVLTSVIAMISLTIGIVIPNPRLIK